MNTATNIRYGDKVHFAMRHAAVGDDANCCATYSIELPQECAPMAFHLEYPRQGISLFWGDAKFSTDFVRQFKVDEGGLVFSTILSGHLEYSLSSPSRGRLKTHAVTNVRPCEMIFFSHQCEGNARIFSGESCRFVSVILSPEIVEEMAASGNLPDPLRQSMEKKPDGIFVHSMAKLTPALRNVSTQILSCPMDKTCKSLFIEGKVLEFLSLHFDKASAKKSLCPPAVTKSDINKLYIAREMLINDILSPPNIQKLSSLCGLNEYKLKKLFPMYFGNTIYGLLQKQRLHHAHTLLQNTDTSVNIVANNVGYSNISHFIAAFRNEFGFTPGNVLKRVRRGLAKI